MAIVRPFNGMRYTKEAGNIKELCCPPYDIISEEMRKKFIKKNTSNVVRLELPGEKGNPYKKAKDTLGKWLESGILSIDEKPCFYIYGEQFTVNGKEYETRGIIGKVYLYELEKGIILPHEETLSKAKEDRFKLMQSTACNFSQVYSLYDDENGRIGKSIEKLSAREPDIRFTDSDGVTHKLWIIERNSEVDKISANMAGKKLYIADGHHRYETALRYRNELREKGIISEFGENEQDYIMMMLTDMNSKDLVVFPTHRIIHSLKKVSINKILNSAAEYFTVSTSQVKETALKKLSAVYEAGGKAFVMYDSKKFYIFESKSGKVLKKLMPKSSDALRSLDVTILHKLIIEDILGIDDEALKNGTNVTYTRDVDEAIAAVNGEANLAFILNPTRVEEIAAVAREGEKMPRKSTYFYPKLITGLVMNKLDRVPPIPPADEENDKKADYVNPEADIILL